MSQTNAKQPDILIFLSDQHTSRLMGCAGDKTVDTPNMDKLAAEGTRFSNANAACPLCVPSRFALLSGMMPSSTGVLGNANIMNSEIATFAHACGAAGYETILCGRMHFSGQDQRHGFERRIMGDFTPCIAGRGGSARSDLGPYVRTPMDQWQNHYGGGEDSPVLAYDRAVVDAALEELKKPHDRPILMVVGTYGPHHTFVAPTELYRKYLDRVPAPLSSDEVDMIDADFKRRSTRDLNDEDIRHVRAAYFGMIEQIDNQVGQVREAFDAHTKANNRTSQFWYLSDHGEQAGNRELWGKMTFYADSVGVPMIMAGDGISHGVCDTPVSLIDIAPTLVDITGGPELAQVEGRSLRPALEGKALEQVDVFSERWTGELGRLVRRGKWKYWSEGIDQEGMLVDCETDPEERRNAASHNPEVAKELHDLLWNKVSIPAVKAEQNRRRDHQNVFNKWGGNIPMPEPDRWPIPESAWVLPTRAETVKQ